VLKIQGCTLLTPAIFRNILSSADYAATQYSFPQSVWERILTSMIKHAQADGIQAGLLIDWLDTRDNAGLPETNVANLEGLDFDAIGRPAAPEVDDEDEDEATE